MASKKKPKPAKPIAKSLVELTESEIRAQIDVIAKQRAKSKTFDKDLALATAALMRALVTAEGEKRQAAKGQVRALAQIPLDQIVEYLKTLPEDKRADISAELAGDHEEASLL